jgi:hypothetical protein
MLCFSYTCRLTLSLSSWNIVGILVLLCQGLLFETSSDQDHIVFAFGVLIVVIVSFCILITMFSTLKQMINPTTRRLLPIPRLSAKHLPQDMVLQLYVLNSLIKMDLEREIEINFEKFFWLLPKEEYKELKNALKSVDEPHMLNPNGAEVYGDGSFALETVMPKRPSDEITPRILDSQDRILAHFTQSFSQKMYH